MSVAYGIDMYGVQDPLGELAGTLSMENRTELNEVMGQAVAILVKQHLTDYSQDHGNALGGKRTFFYRDAAMSTNSDADQSGATVTVAKRGIRLQFYGGTVLPGRNPSSLTGKPTTKLTIPAAAEAHGKRASEFPNLVALWGKNGPYALAEKLVTRKLPKSGKLKKGESAFLSRGKLKGVKGGKLLFWLVDSATVGEHPDILPDEAAIGTAATEAGWRYIFRKLGRRGST